MLHKKLVFFMTLSLPLGLMWLETQRDALKVPHVPCAGTPPSMITAIPAGDIHS
jgi:hypothetical protein